MREVGVLRSIVIALAVLALSSLTACAPPRSNHIVIGAKNFTEQVVLGELLAQHIEHATGSGWTPEGQDKLYERISAKGIPWLSYDDVIQWACVMNRFDAPMIFNHQDWGFAGESLRETSPGAHERAGAP